MSEENTISIKRSINIRAVVTPAWKEEAEKEKISDKIEEIIVPTHDVTEVKRGKRVQRKKNISQVTF